MGLRPESWTNRPRILTLDLIRSEHTDDERLRFIALPSNRSERLCRPIQFLRIQFLSFFPNSQATAAILRANVSRAISSRMPFF